MKVLQIIDSLATGGAEKLILDSVPLYRKQAVDMDVLVLKDANYPFMKKLKENSSCKIFILGSGSVYNPVYIFKIAKILPQYDIAHVHLFPAQYWAVLAKVWSKAKTKLIFTEHNTSNRRIQNKFLGLIDRYFYRKFDKIVAISSEIRGVLKSHTKQSDNKFQVIHNGVDIKDILSAQKLKKTSIGFLEKDFVLIQVSSFRQPKDQFTLIKALIHLPDNIKLLLVGEGQNLKSCKDLANKLNLINRVIFLGLRSDVPQLLKTADVVVLSSHYEGMSLSSIEGMVSGRPFIASDVPGLREIVKGAGILFEKGNDEALANEIKKLSSDQNLYRKTVEDCLSRAKAFDISKMVLSYVSLYKDVYRN